MTKAQSKYLNLAKGNADVKDIPILAAALQAGVDYPITFNTKDYYPYSSMNIEILRPGDFLNVIQRGIQ